MFKTAKVHDVVKGEDTIDGTGVLVDRMWPRGVAKSDLAYDEWFKDCLLYTSPSPRDRQKYRMPSSA